MSEMTAEKLQELGEKTKVLKKELIDGIFSDDYYNKTDYKERFSLQIPIEMDGKFKHAIVHTGYDPYNIYGNGYNYNRYDKDASFSQAVDGFDIYAIGIYATVENGDLDTVQAYGLSILNISGEKPIEECSFWSFPKEDADNFHAVARTAIAQYYEREGNNYPQVQLPDGKTQKLTGKTGVEIVYESTYRDEFGSRKVENETIQFYGIKTGEVIQTYGYENSSYGSVHTFCTADEASKRIADEAERLKERGILKEVRVVSESKEKQQIYDER